MWTLRTKKKEEEIRKFIKYLMQAYLKNTNRKGGRKMVKARCMRCRKEVEVKNPQEVEIKKGTWAVKGVCPDCGTKVFRIIGKKK